MLLDRKSRDVPLKAGGELAAQRVYKRSPCLNEKYGSGVRERPAGMKPSREGAGNPKAPPARSG